MLLLKRSKIEARSRRLSSTIASRAINKKQNKPKTIIELSSMSESKVEQSKQF